MSLKPRSRSWLLGLTVCFAFAAVRAQSPAAAANPEVVQIKLGLSNVFLIKAARPVLVDAGSPKDLPALTEALATHGLRAEDIALVVLTHAHSDHAGLAAHLQRSGAKLALGQGDLAMASAGHNDELKPTSAMASLLKAVAIDPKFPPFTPDFAVQNTLDLAPWGVKGRVLALPGHTPGSQVLLLDDGRAWVGDMVLGGYLGGAVLPQRAGEHYFHADRTRNLANIRQLLSRSVKSFHLGHGGPVDRASVIEGFDLAEPTAAR